MPGRKILFVVVLLLAGCGGQEHELVVGTNNWLGYLPLYLARDAGYYDGIPLQLQQLPSNTESMRALRNGRITAAGLTLDEALLLAESGAPVCIPLIMDYSNGADAVVAQAGITSLAQLQGKRIGVENTTVAAHMLTSSLDQAGLSVGDIKVVPLAVHEHIEAFESGRVDVLVTFEPVRSHLIAGGANEIFSSAMIPGEVTDVLVVQREYLANHPEVVSTLLEGWFEIIGRLQDENAATDLNRELADYSGLDPDSIRESLRLIEFPQRHENRRILRDQAATFRRMASAMNQTMIRQKIIGSMIKVDELLCSSDGLGVYR